MTFASLPLGVVVVGLTGLAAVLYLLQRLRVRHREVPVVTTLFWAEAIEESRARVLVKRFRHPLAYLLVLAIASLIWLALADPRRAGGEREDVVLLLDASAVMSRPGRFEAAAQAAAKEAERIDPARRTVILCGAAPVTVLAAGEDALLLPRRLAGAVPEAAPETLTTTIRALAAAAGGDSLRIRIFGDAPVPAGRRELLPGNVAVERATAPPPAGGNRGIVALGLAEAASGRWDTVDALVVVAAPEGAPAPEVGGTLDGRPLPAGDLDRRPDGRAEIRFSDLPARGGLLEVALAGRDAIAADDGARIRVPDRPPIRVALLGEIPEALTAVLAADPSVRVVDEAPDVPVLAVDPDADGVDSIRLVDPSGRDPVEVLSRALADLALDEIDAMEIADRTGRPVTVGVEPGTRREVRIAASLFGGRYDFVGQRAFPIFVGRVVRWLAGDAEFPVVVAAGRPVPGADAARADASGATLEPAGAGFVPPAAGLYSAAGEPDLGVSLLDPSLVRPGEDGADRVATAPDGGGPVDALTVLGLLAFALLTIEWWLFRTGRMP